MRAMVPYDATVALANWTWAKVHVYLKTHVEVRIAKCNHVLPINILIRAQSIEHNVAFQMLCERLREPFVIILVALVSWLVALVSELIALASRFVSWNAPIRALQPLLQIMMKSAAEVWAFELKANWIIASRIQALNVYSNTLQPLGSLSTK